MSLLVTTSSGFRAHAIYLLAAIPLLVAVVVAIVVWRNARKERSSRALLEGLSSLDPEVRRRTLDDVTDDVLSQNAPLLCELLDREEDLDVLDALAAAVARSRWEPTDDPALVELRRWVAGGHSRTTRSSASAPSAPAPDATDVAVAPVAAATAVATATQVREPVVAPRDDHDDAVGHDALGDIDAPRDAFARRPPPDATPAPLDELVPKVRALLGDDLERLELVSIDGEVLARWSAAESGGAGQSPK